MLISFKNGQSGIILRIKILDSSKSDGSGLGGLTSGSGGLIISTIADNESAPVTYRSVNSDVESITTLGVYQAPSPGKCRFREVHPNYHRGVYEIQLNDARFSIAGARGMLVTISGATNAAESDALIPLTVFDPYAINGGYDPWTASIPGSYGAGTAGARLGFIDTTVSSRLAGSSYTSSPAAGTIAAAVWDEVASAHTAPASFGARVDAAVSSRLAASNYSSSPSAAAVASAVWDEATSAHTAPTSFGARVDAAISSRLASSTYTSPPSAAAVASAVWDEATSAHTAPTSFGARVDAEISSRLASSTYTPPPSAAVVASAVWDETGGAHTAAGSFGARVDAPVSTRLSSSSYSPAPSASMVASAVWEESTNLHTTSGSFAARLDTPVSSRSTFAGGSVQSVVDPVTVGVNNDKTEYMLALAGLDQIPVEQGINVRQALSPMLAALAGVVAGAGTSSVQILGANTNTVRIAASTDASGNRTSVNLDLPT